MRLIHLANFNSTNVGNGALISGTEESISNDIPSLYLLPESWDDYTFGLKKFDENFVKMVNVSDGLLIGAAVTFNGQKYQTKTGTRIELPLDLWDKIIKPVIFYGVSFRHWKNQKYNNLNAFRKTFGLILNKENFLISVRNDGTLEWLEKILDRKLSEKVYVIPDPAIYVKTEDRSHPEIYKDKKNIILSLNNEDEVYRFSGRNRELLWPLMSFWIPEKSMCKIWRSIPGWDRKRTVFLKNLSGALEMLSKEMDINVILAPHYFDDFKIISRFIPMTPLRFPHQVLISTGMARANQSSYFYDLYKKADLSLSMRVHSMSPSIGLGTPTIALTSQSRMTEFLKDSGLETIGLDIFDELLANKLYEKMKYNLDSSDIARQNLVNTVSRLRARTKNFHIDVLLPFLKRHK